MDDDFFFEFYTYDKEDDGGLGMVGPYLYSFDYRDVGIADMREILITLKDGNQLITVLTLTNDRQVYAAYSYEKFKALYRKFRINYYKRCQEIEEKALFLKSSDS